MGETDIEAQVSTASSLTVHVSRAGTVEIRQNTLQLLYPLSDVHLRSCGIHENGGWWHHIEESFGALMGDDFAIIWKLIGISEPESHADGWRWCLSVVNAFQALPDEHSSIDDVYRHLVHNCGIAQSDIEEQERDAALLAIFAVLCWTSMTLSPVLSSRSCESPSSRRQFPFRVKESSQVPALQVAKRPVSKVFRGFRGQTERLKAGSGANLDTLYESSLNYYSLATIGRIRLKWVDSLVQHLDFDAHSRVLSVFRFPTFCIANILRTDDIQVLQNITQELFPSPPYAEHPASFASLHREIILSYLLLFGQSSRARRLLHDSLTRSQSDYTHGVDTFLWELSMRPLTRKLWPFYKPHKFPLLPSILPSSVVNPDETILELEAYSAQDDFPIFGDRLLALQRYNLRQQPSKVRDLWRDRRNPLQWYTFWAVLWVGGVSITLSLLQLGVSATQLYYGVRQVA